MGGGGGGAAGEGRDEATRGRLKGLGKAKTQLSCARQPLGCARGPSRPGSGHSGPEENLAAQVWSRRLRAAAASRPVSSKRPQPAGRHQLFPQAKYPR